MWVVLGCCGGGCGCCVIAVRVLCWYCLGAVGVLCSSCEGAVVKVVCEYHDDAV